MFHKCLILSSSFSVLFFPVLLQRPPEEDSPSAMCELLPALERRDGLSGSDSLYHMSLCDPFSVTPICPNSIAELPSQSNPTDRTVGSRTPNSKRTTDGSSPGQATKKARRRTADRLPLAQHNAEKKQKESSSVSPILQQHNKTTVCVCWNTHPHTDMRTLCVTHQPAASPLIIVSSEDLFLLFAILLHFLTVQTTLAVETVERCDYSLSISTTLIWGLRGFGRVLMFFLRHLVSLFQYSSLKCRFLFSFKTKLLILQGY